MISPDLYYSELALLAENGAVLGEVWFGCRDGGYGVRHVADTGRPDLCWETSPNVAQEIAKYDETGAYRPLKSAPTLRRGWGLQLATLQELRLALDFLYPAMFGTWLWQRKGRLPAGSLRETFGRQTGMYRVTSKITDEQAQVLTGMVCASAKCLKTVLWTLDGVIPMERRNPETVAGKIPLFCQEPCNILVAAARECVKTSPAEVAST